MTFLLFMLFVTGTLGQDYFTIWLNDGNKLMPYMDQLIDQNTRFNDMLIVDEPSTSAIGGHSNTILDTAVFDMARTKKPAMTERLNRLQAVYSSIKPSNPAAASDILRFVAFIGLDGNEFVYHDVDIKIGTPISGLRQPIATAMIGTENKAHLGKNWVMRSIYIPSQVMNLAGSNINNDLIGFRRSDGEDFLVEYIDAVVAYYDTSLGMTFTTSQGEEKTLRDIVTAVDNPSETYLLPTGSDYTSIVGGIDVAKRAALQQTGVTKRRLQALMTWGACMAQYEKLLQRIFVRDYYIPLPPDDSPYAVAERKYTFLNLELKGDTAGILNFVRDYIADPIKYGVLSRKHNVNWYGLSTGQSPDIAPLDAQPLDGEVPSDWEDTDYEDYDDDSLEEQNMDISAELVNECSFRRRRRSLCNREDPDKYVIGDDGMILFDGKSTVTRSSKFVYVHEMAVDENSVKYRKYKFIPTDTVRDRLIDLERQILARTERFLDRPSGRQAQFDLRNKYVQIYDSIDDVRRYVATKTPLTTLMSRRVRMFNRLKFGVGYATSMAFSTQFLARAISSKHMDMSHKVALGTIGSVGIAELSYVTALKLTRPLSANALAVFAKVGGAFKVLGVATAAYFAVDSSITLSKNPADVEAWWWLSRSVTMFTPLNRLFIPFDLTLIVTKQIISASWDLSAVSNRVRLLQDERAHYHAMSFFGIDTKWVTDVRNVGMFRTNIVNPTVNYLRKFISDRYSDQYAVVGFPAMTICNNTLVPNTADEFETDIDSASRTVIPTEIGSLSTARMEMCLSDAQILCAPQELSGWEWFLSVIAKTSRVRGRGADIGVGCILMDGTMLSGHACDQIDIIRRDLQNRVQVFVKTGSSEDEMILPFLRPSDYTFNFTSVSNGSVVEISTARCTSAFKWRNKIAPYILTSPTKTSGRIDYIGVPTSPGKTTFKTRQDNPTRVYVYRSNGDGRCANISVIGSGSHSNEFVVTVRPTDKWTLMGGNAVDKLIIGKNTTDSVVVMAGTVHINDHISAFMIDTIDMTESPDVHLVVMNTASNILVGSTSNVFVATNQTTTGVVSLYSSSKLFGHPNSTSNVVSNGKNIYVGLDDNANLTMVLNRGASVNVTMAKWATANINMTEGSELTVRSDCIHCTYCIVHGMSDASWRIQQRSNGTTVISDTEGRQLTMSSGTVILAFETYYITVTAGMIRQTVVFAELDTRVIDRLVNPIVYVKSRNGTILTYVSSRYVYTVPPNVHSFAISDDVSVVIPAQTSKQLDFYGDGNVTVVNDMIDCGNGRFAHYTCDQAITISKQNLYI